MRVPLQKRLASHLVQASARSPVSASRRQLRAASTSTSSLSSSHARHNACSAGSATHKRRYSTVTDDAAPVSHSYVRPPTLDEELWAAYKSSRPSEKELKARQTALTQVQNTFDGYARFAHFHFPGLPHNVETFGGIRCGLDRAGSDLDLTVADPRMPSGWRPGVMERDMNERPLYMTHAVAKFFTKHTFENVKALPRARVPIVTATVPSDPPIAFDLSFNALEGTFAARLINSYISMNDKIPPLVDFLKTWMDARGLYKVIKLKKTTEHVRRPFNGHTIVLMVIAYMQTMRILPNLQEPFATAGQRATSEDITHISRATGRKLQAQSSAAFSPSLGLPDVSQYCDLIDIWWYLPGKSGNWRIPMDTRFVPASSEAVQSWMRKRAEAMQAAGVKEMTLAELLQGFFEFYSHFPWEKFAISIRDGGIIHRTRRTRAPDLIKQIDLLGLERRLIDFRLRQDAPAELVNSAAALLLRKFPDLPPNVATPVLVLDPFTGCVPRITTHATNKGDRHTFDVVCKKAATAAANGARLEDILKLPANRQTAEAPPALEGELPVDGEDEVDLADRIRGSPYARKLPPRPGSGVFWVSARRLEQDQDQSSALDSGSDGLEDVR